MAKEVTEFNYNSLLIRSGELSQAYLTRLNQIDTGDYAKATIAAVALAKLGAHMWHHLATDKTLSDIGIPLDRDGGPDMENLRTPLIIATKEIHEKIDALVFTLRKSAQKGKLAADKGFIDGFSRKSTRQFENRVESDYINKIRKYLGESKTSWEAYREIADEMDIEIPNDIDTAATEFLTARRDTATPKRIQGTAKNKRKQRSRRR